MNQRQISKKIEQFKKHSFATFLVAITLYTALVNSYALFSVYPALKQHHAALPLVIYLLLSAPLWIYGLVILPNIRQGRQAILGIIIVILAVAIRLLQSHDPFGLVVLSTLVYLLTGFIEETLWRGVIWRTVAAKTKSTKQTYAYVTLHFTILHIPFSLLRMANPLLFLGEVLALGLALGGLRIASNSVKLPAFVHAAVNVLAKT